MSGGRVPFGSLISRSVVDGGGPGWFSVQTGAVGDAECTEDAVRTENDGGG